MARREAGEFRRVAGVAVRALQVAQVAPVERLQVTRQVIELRPRRGGEEARVDECVALRGEPGGEARLRAGRGRQPLRQRETSAQAFSTRLNDTGKGVRSS